MFYSHSSPTPPHVSPRPAHGGLAGGFPATRGTRQSQALIQGEPHHTPCGRAGAGEGLVEPSRVQTEGPLGRNLPCRLCSCPRGNTAWTSRPGRSGWCPRGSLLQDTPPAGSWASHVWPPPGVSTLGCCPPAPALRAPSQAPPSPVVPEFRLLDSSMPTMNRKLVLALSAIPLFLPFIPPTFRPPLPSQRTPHQDETCRSRPHPLECGHS